MLIGIAGKKQSGKNTVASILGAATIHIDPTITHEDIDLMREQYRNDLDSPFTRIVADITSGIIPSASTNHYSFANPVKQIAAILSNNNTVYMNSDMCKAETIPSYIDIPNGDSYRDLFKYIGTEVGRKMFGDSIWVDILANSLKRNRNYFDLHLITDVRFKNECEFVKRAGGTVITVSRLATEEGDTHPSETLDGVTCDYLIENNGSISDLIARVLHVYISLLENKQ